MKSFMATVFLMVCPLVFGQAEPAAPYQIPATVYIGDYGKLVYPLDTFFFNQGTIVIPLDTVPVSADIIIHHIELTQGKLMIDFQPFRTGRIPLPPVTVAGKTLEGLEVSVASLLSGKDAAILSPAAAPVNAPGTLWLITAVAASIIAVTGITLVLVMRGGDFFYRLRIKISKRRALALLLRTVKKHKLPWEKGDIDTAALLSALSAALRHFLEEYCGVRCVSLVPAEFLRLSFPEQSMPSALYTPEWFAGFFTRCDTARFSGAQISKETTYGIIEEIDEFAVNIKRKLREL